MAPLVRIFLFLLGLTLTGWHTAISADLVASGGSDLQLQWHGTFSRDEQVKLRRWLAHAADCAATLYGTLPRKQIHIVLQRADKANEPVPFGHTLRNERQGVRFLVNPSFPLQRFIDDWTAVHELVHLYIPYPGERDIWLSEGLATYYQNLLQARAGVITEQRAWQNLYNGFVRGQKDNRYRHLNLAQISQRMNETRSFMRVYWAGTSYFLQVDLLLRQQSDNRQSLDTVIRDFVACCLVEQDYRNGQQLVQAFDRVAGNQVFSRLYREYREFHAQPDPLPLLAQLGIRVQNKKVILDKQSSAPVRMRRAMTEPGHSLPLTSQSKPRRE